MVAVVAVVFPTRGLMFLALVALPVIMAVVAVVGQLRRRGRTQPEMVATALRVPLLSCMRPLRPRLLL